LSFGATGQGTVTTLAGTYIDQGIAYQDGPGEVARFGGIGGLALGSDGTLYASDFTHGIIRKIRVDADGKAMVSRMAGGGTVFGTTQSVDFADGRALESAFSGPRGLLPRPDGSILVADSKNHRIRSLVTGGGGDWVSTFAGRAAGLADGPLDMAQLFYPRVLASDAKGQVYVLEGNFRFQLRKIVM
jgi:hypothetical protein